MEASRDEAQMCYLWSPDGGGLAPASAIPRPCRTGKKSTSPSLGCPAGGLIDWQILPASGPGTRAKSTDGGVEECGKWHCDQRPSDPAQRRTHDHGEDHREWVQLYAAAQRDRDGKRAGH